MTWTIFTWTILLANRISAGYWFPSPYMQIVNNILGGNKHHHPINFWTAEHFLRDRKIALVLRVIWGVFVFTYKKANNTVFDLYNCNSDFRYNIFELFSDKTSIFGRFVSIKKSSRFFLELTIKSSYLRCV